MIVPTFFSKAPLNLRTTPEIFLAHFWGFVSPPPPAGPLSRSLLRPEDLNSRFIVAKHGGFHRLICPGDLLKQRSRVPPQTRFLRFPFIDFRLNRRPAGWLGRFFTSFFRFGASHTMGPSAECVVQQARPRVLFFFFLFFLLPLRLLKLPFCA